MSSEVDKKSEEKTSQNDQATGGILWRMSSGLVNSATGVVTGAAGLGVSGAKWIVGKGADVGSAIAHTTISVGSVVTNKLPYVVSKKDKKE